MWWELGEVGLGGVGERLWELEQFHKQFKRDSWQHSGVSVTLTYITYCFNVALFSSFLLQGFFHFLFIFIKAALITLRTINLQMKSNCFLKWKTDPI